MPVRHVEQANVVKSVVLLCADQEIKDGVYDGCRLLDVALDLLTKGAIGIHVFGVAGHLFKQWLGHVGFDCRYERMP